MSLCVASLCVVRLKASLPVTSHLGAVRAPSGRPLRTCSLCEWACLSQGPPPATRAPALSRRSRSKQLYREQLDAAGSGGGVRGRTMTLDTWMGASLVMMPPGEPSVRLMFFLHRLRPSTISLFLCLKTLSTEPVCPLSFPSMIITWSPRTTCTAPQVSHQGFDQAIGSISLVRPMAQHCSARTRRSSLLIPPTAPPSLHVMASPPHVHSPCHSGRIDTDTSSNLSIETHLPVAVQRLERPDLAGQPHLARAS